MIDLTYDEVVLTCRLWQREYDKQKRRLNRSGNQEDERIARNLLDCARRYLGLWTARKARLRPIPEQRWCLVHNNCQKWIGGAEIVNRPEEAEPFITIADAEAVRLRQKCPRQWFVWWLPKQYWQEEQS